MRWRTSPAPEWGATRDRRRFAWWPVDCTDGTTRWLEPVIAHERYQGFVLYNWVVQFYEAIV